MNPIKALVDAYLEGRRWQMEKMDQEIKLLERIADALEEMVLQVKKVRDAEK